MLLRKQNDHSYDGAEMIKFQDMDLFLQSETI